MKNDHPDCYSILIAEKIIPNGITQNPTVVELLDGISLSQEAFGKYIQLVALFRLKGKGTDIQTKPVWVDSTGRAHPASDSHDTNDIPGYARLLSPMLKLPPAPGEYKLVLEVWEPRGGEEGKWVRGTAYAPFTFVLVEPPAATAPPS